MVIGSALCALNLASSVMVNGACCFYEMQKDEERKKEHQKAIRHAMRSEWDRNRHLEIMRRKEEKERDVRHAYASRSQEHRRQKLMRTKQASVVGANPTSDSSASFTDHREPLRSVRNNMPDTRKRPSTSIMSDTSAFSAPLPRFKEFETSQVLVRPQSIKMAKPSNLKHYPQRQLSSLMDDSEDEDEAFEDVTIE